MHLFFRNCNDAFRGLVQHFYDPKVWMYEGLPIKTTSRVGDVLQIPSPVTVTYQNPLERVLFNEARDCNPFFHVMEALWMLAGRRDIAPMAYYASNYATQVQDGENPNANGAYGYRWRNASAYWGAWKSASAHSREKTGEIDQLPVVIDQLKRKPESRRVVLEMWNAADDLQAIDDSKDVCCNTHAYFLINNGKLDMTVCNRSNDLVWGMLGANVVHFSFLQEYLAANIGVPVGVYNQFTNNLHVYTERFKPELWLADMTPDYYTLTDYEHRHKTALVSKPDQFEKELMEFNEHCLAKPILGKAQFDEPFFADVACPMQLAFSSHKQRNYKAALGYANEVSSDDWRIACVSWLRRRQAKYEADGPRYDGDNPMLKNELERIQKGSDHAGAIKEEE